MYDFYNKIVDLKVLETIAGILQTTKILERYFDYKIPAPFQ
jgi:hypothetical protein